MIVKPKGTYDLYGEQMKKWQYVSRVVDEVMDRYNYGLIRTPIFESTELFHRGVGDTTDIVSKETYDFIDRGERNMTLRPEGTAGVVRSYIENKMYGNMSDVVKVYYNGPMFRYEQPQAGRYREFNQFGVEFFDGDGPYVDTSVIELAHTIFKKLGISSYYKVHVNTIGNFESRTNYTKALKEYFENKID